MSYLNIPAELRALPNFICWRYVYNDNEKPTKEPVNPHTGRLASVTVPGTWSTFEHAVSVASTYNGIGLVITDDCPFSCIDLDPTDDPEVRARHIAIAEAFPTYQEISPSGSGLHLWVKGKTPSNCNRKNVEIYTGRHYLTMTGNVYKAGPIQDHNELLNSLWQEITTTQNEVVNSASAEEKQSDYEILKVASSAANAQKFVDLYEGRWQQYYNDDPKKISCSEADYAICNIVAHYTQNHAQIARIFRSSALGKRAKAQRDDYLFNPRYGIVIKALDRVPPNIDLDGLKNSLELMFAEQRKQIQEITAPVLAVQNVPQLAASLNTQVAPQTPISIPAIASPTNAVYNAPEGLVGDLARFIYQSSPRPVPEISLAGALGFMAGVCGKAYNVSGTGLNQYILLLASTGCHAKGTEILMYDGSVKLVEDITIGDKLMGPDSDPRIVLNLARGVEQMARIIPVKGEPFVVNVNHILPLYKTRQSTTVGCWKSLESSDVNITVKDYLKTSASFKHLHKLKRTGVTFKNKWSKLPLDPWFLGAMLGDGHFTTKGGSPTLTSMDAVILDKAKQYIETLNLTVRHSQVKGNKASQNAYTNAANGMDKYFGDNFNKNELTKRLRYLGLWNMRSGTKFIPHIYKTATREERLSLLAGIIDTDGSLSCNGYDFISKSKQLADDVCFVARSLGLAAYVKSCEKYSQNNTGGTYYRVSITGNTFEIPCVLEHKKAKPRSQIKNVLVTGFEIELLNEDNFYGFALDKDHLYLTSDFTIHHNTGKEAVHSGIDKIINYVRKTVPACDEFVGPGEIASPQALIKHLNKKSKCFVSLVGEFGLMLKQISSIRANPNQIGLRRVMLELYNKSGIQDSYKAIIYSDREKNTDSIQGPAFSILGESTPERFYETLTDEMIYEGLLPRFTIIEYQGNRPQLNKQHLAAVMPDRLVEQVSQLCAYALQLNNGGNVVNVQQSNEAQLIFEEFNLKCDAALNSAHNEIIRHLWNRAHMKSLKLSGLLAAGTNYINPTISKDQAMWAIKLIEADIENLLKRFENGSIGAPVAQNEQAVDIQKAFKRYLKADWSDIEKYPGASQITHLNRLVPHSFITAYCRNRASFKADRLGPVNAIKTQLQSLLETGEIQELGPTVKAEKKLPRNGKLYCVSEVKWLK